MTKNLKTMVILVKQVFRGSTIRKRIIKRGIQRKTTIKKRKQKKIKKKTNLNEVRERAKKRGGRQEVQFRINIHQLVSR